MNTGEIMELLRTKFSAPAYALIEDVGRSTGFANGRADGIAMSLWPSRGFDLIGLEVKASRSDWLRELKNPEKADRFIMFMNYWYIVAGDKDIVKTDELPRLWGLMVPSGGRLKIVKHAEPLAAKTVDNGFLAAIMRKVHEHKAVMTEGDRRAAIAANDKMWEVRNKHEEAEHNKLRKAVKDFQEASGVRIESWSHTSHEIGAAVKTVLEGSNDVNHYIEEVKTVERILERLKKETDETIKALTQLKEKPPCPSTNTSAGFAEQ